ncbi:hypothetical protein A2833_02725 [Candidatus Azambacteria bacterium RIFCSPHIGHO2_01_FULL_44_55]|uniref:Hydrolase TatD n=1 Tax=Candidatus Azambacteria bacterium RIFCSPLOWO2_02_FULL_44_14 TaxID=1797306 RepID=A0A1F5CA92_9BACT|nr:MAG: hypothetical protein A3A18_01660 [Candidatus Azambacteria bacterium RIFCSPLOWO2_01_FULL_44_84]OGD32814.1 MAG: hypothetical protein A3C78_03375 [Candidatus Azambacteria bacterium RIFCSPHIGHO2_02_FULL_45_18]OGD39780.1 MAG: hypothetical protein A3I30_02140 [Candidatus Azambacteria bacterium RIFCSPLOWO2_02_FULL_44_14]OGD40473.1 MAG: hypothetical protein A2833_02725 [Candidatus Azambacteria bacterium RIFCSPHIGHO2_01_FULL_44_55]OGD52100.1 MAG: hypothetical protein A2608_00310 [Candidatus Azam
MLFDSHTHLQFPQFDGDREGVISRLLSADIKVINVGTDLEDSKKAIELAKKYLGQMWATVGLHPNDAVGQNFDISKYKKLAENDSVVAIGECGLDYFRTPDDDKNRQKDIFLRQLELVRELSKPLMIHCRPKAEDDAYLDLFEILSARGESVLGGKYRNLNLKNGNGTSHFFAGSKKTAKQFLDLGFYISFAGPITFAKEYEEVVKYVPLDKILIETDAPFAAPAPHRGKRNEPTFVEFVARKIAEIKEVEFEEVARQTAENAKKLFNLDF